MESIIHFPTTVFDSANTHQGFNDTPKEVDTASCCFGDDLETFAEYTPATPRAINPTRSVVSELATTVVPSKPAPCVVTRSSVSVKFMAPKSDPTKASQENSSDKAFIDQVFKVNYQLSLTNCNLASKNSDLHMENINLHEAIGKMKLDNSKQVDKLNDLINSLKKDNYQLSLNLSDLTLSNVEYRKEAADLKRETDYFTTKLKNGPPSELSTEQPDPEPEIPSIVVHSVMSAQNSVEQGSFSAQKIETLANENNSLRAEIEKLRATHRSSIHHILEQRVNFLKQLQIQLHNDTKFIEGTQLLQMEKDFCLSSWNKLRHDYNELQHKFDTLASRHGDPFREMELQKHCDTGSLSAQSLATGDRVNEIFDNFASGTETAETISTSSRWRRFYKRGSLASTSCGLRRSKTYKIFHPISS